MMYNVGADTYIYDYDIKQEKCSFVQRKNRLNIVRSKEGDSFGEYCQQVQMNRDQHYKVFIHFTSLNSWFALEPIPAAFRPHQFITQDKQPTACTYGQFRVSQVTLHAYYWSM